MMHIIVAGCRDFNDYSVVEKEMMDFVGKFIGKVEIEIISGGASGVDALGEHFTQEYGLGLKVVPADWKTTVALPILVETSRWLGWLALLLPFGMASLAAPKT